MPVVEGKIKIDNFELSDGRYRLNFEIFQKTSKVKEVVSPINTLQAVFDSNHEELIRKLDEFK